MGQERRELMGALMLAFGINWFVNGVWGDEERGRPGSRRVGWFNPFRYGLLQFPLV